MEHSTHPLCINDSDSSLTLSPPEVEQWTSARSILEGSLRQSHYNRPFVLNGWSRWNLIFDSRFARPATSSAREKRDHKAEIAVKETMLKAVLGARCSVEKESCFLETLQVSKQPEPIAVLQYEKRNHDNIPYMFLKPKWKPQGKQLIIRKWGWRNVILVNPLSFNTTNY